MGVRVDKDGRLVRSESAFEFRAGMLGDKAERAKLPKRSEPFWRVVARDGEWALAIGLDKRLHAPEWRARWVAPWGGSNHTSVGEADVGRGGLSYDDAVKKA